MADGAAIHNSQLRNRAHTVLLLGGMTLLLGALGWSLGGSAGIVYAAVLGIMGMFLGARASAHLLLRLYAARPISAAEAPDLHAIAGEIAGRAGLDAVPFLFYVPSRMMQAFSVQLRRGPAVAVTDGLLRGMSAREVAAVLAARSRSRAHRAGGRGDHGISAFSWIAAACGPGTRQIGGVDGFYSLIRTNP